MDLGSSIHWLSINLRPGSLGGAHDVKQRSCSPSSGLCKQQHHSRYVLPSSLSFTLEPLWKHRETDIVSTTTLQPSKEHQPKPRVNCGFSRSTASYRCILYTLAELIGCPSEQSYPGFAAVLTDCESAFIKCHSQVFAEATVYRRSFG